MRAIQFSAIVFLLLCLASGAQAQLVSDEQAQEKQQEQAEVTIFTTLAPPFSNAEGDGYSIDLMTDILQRMHGEPGVRIGLAVVPTINDILDSVQAHPNSPTNYSVGISDISVTPGRSEVIDYLSPYYNSGLRILTFDNRSDEEWMRSATLLVLKLVGIIAAVMALIIFVFVTFAFASEQFMTPEGKVPNHRNYNTIQALKQKGDFVTIPLSKLGLGLHDRRITYHMRIILSNFMFTLKHTFSTMTGSTLSKPNSVGAALVVGIIAMVFVAIKLLMTPIMVTLFDSVSSGSMISSYAEMSGHAVCTIAGTTSPQFLRENDVGFTKIVEYPTLAHYEQAIFENHVCVAAVYDDPTQQYLITKNAAGGAGKAVLVGERFNKDRYAAVVSKSLDQTLKNQLDRITIAYTLEHKTMSGLQQQWFPNGFSTSSDEQASVPYMIVVFIVAAAAGTWVLVMLWTYARYDKYEDGYDKVVRTGPSKLTRALAKLRAWLGLDAPPLEPAQETRERVKGYEETYREQHDDSFDDDYQATCKRLNGNERYLLDWFQKIDEIHADTLHNRRLLERHAVQRDDPALLQRLNRGLIPGQSLSNINEANV